MRKDFLGLWIAEDGKSLLIEEDNGQYCVSVAPDLNTPYYKRPHLFIIGSRTHKIAATWNTDENEYPFLQVEAGANGIGPTYHLIFTVKNPDQVEPEFVLAKENDNIDKIYALPETQIGLYDDWEEDLGIPWAKPLLPFRHASNKEKELFIKNHNFKGFLKRLFNLKF